ncbi:hypothetical protein Pint_28703 [Pistacia integerrima]|uniref:Uncharacterized protein n=1 Tax=Pistacia integerrima TaxID=434235 RepID=A0ACC0YTW3_9ROSI|nr:hypothetical protein Pint_28703 [Pistacia integerrima]
MGNCWGSFSKEANPTTPSNTSINNPTTPGLSNNYSHTTEISVTSSSAGKSQFSEAVSEGGEEASENGQILETPNLKVFSFADLKVATKNFKSDTLLGEGGFGKVFKGWIDEKTLAPSKSGIGMVVAIKKLNPERYARVSRMAEYLLPLIDLYNARPSEVNFLGRLSHPNLVKLLGYCWEDKELLLVYEFMQKGSLENHLFRRNPSIEPLSWDIRLKIAIGAARGLAFLHASEKKVIYRDFKASNILLDGLKQQLGSLPLPSLLNDRQLDTPGFVPLPMVKLDGVISLDEWVRVVDGTSIIGIKVWDAFLSKLNRSDFAKLKLWLVIPERVKTEATIRVIKESEVLICLGNRLYIYESSRVGLICPNLAINKNMSLHEDGNNFTNYNAKISDFGLAKLGPAGGESHVTTRVMGTYGYAAPEYIATGHLYVKSDVYGFGVVLLEMLTGLRALDTKRPTGEQNLVEWMKPMLSQKKKLKTIMDARIEGQYSTKAAQQAAQLALKCLEADPKHRPSMKEVVETLERVEAIKEKPRKVFSSSCPPTKHGAQPPSHLRSPLHSKHRVKT